MNKHTAALNLEALEDRFLPSGNVVIGHGFTLFQSGSNNRVTFGGSGDRALVAGSSNGITIHGSNDTVQVAGSGNQVTVYGGHAHVTIAGSNDQVFILHGNNLSIAINQSNAVIYI